MDSCVHHSLDRPFCLESHSGLDDYNPLMIRSFDHGTNLYYLSTIYDEQGIFRSFHVDGEPGLDRHSKKPHASQWKIHHEIHISNIFLLGLWLQAPEGATPWLRGTQVGSPETWPCLDRLWPNEWWSDGQWMVVTAISGGQWMVNGLSKLMDFIIIAKLSSRNPHPNAESMSEIWAFFGATLASWDLTCSGSITLQVRCGMRWSNGRCLVANADNLHVSFPHFAPDLK